MKQKKFMSVLDRKIVHLLLIVAIILAQPFIFARPIGVRAAETLPATPPSGYDRVNYGNPQSNTYCLFFFFHSFYCFVFQHIHSTFENGFFLKHFHYIYKFGDQIVKALSILIFQLKYLCDT